MEKFVAYYRVSTSKQGASGLGLEAQQAAVESYVGRESGQIVAPPFVEIESGKLKDRPQLKRAIAHARQHKAVLLVAKLDRLARNVSFLANLLEAGVDFRACDNPHATRLTIHILAAVAEEEARAISERTKAALKAAKARGVKLGSSRENHWQGREQQRSEGQKKATIAATKLRKSQHMVPESEVLPKLLELRNSGQSLREIAQEMNRQEILSPTGRAWNPMMVQRLLKTRKSKTD
jgi:DNA invertase Pin-like site-specific DNA recombinase